MKLYLNTIYCIYDDLSNLVGGPKRQGGSCYVFGSGRIDFYTVASCLHYSFTMTLVPTTKLESYKLQMLDML